MPSQPLTRILPDSPWFALADVALVLFAGVLWYLSPELGAWPLLPALLPWGIRLAFRRFPFKRTALDPLFLLFLLTAVVGIWAAFDQARALAKFWLVLDGVLLFYALAGQPRENLWKIVWAAGAAAAVMPFYYFLTHDWTVEPAKIALLNRIGLAWMSLRPTLPAHVFHPNTVAGFTLLAAPFLAIAVWRARRSKQAILAASAGSGLLLALLALLMTTSRGTWLVLAAIAGIGLLWFVAGVLAGPGKARRGWIFAGLVIAVLVLGVVVASAFPGGLFGLLNRLPGPTRTESRLELLQALAFLIGDFPFTGGGLDSFPGLYSRYILGIPSYRQEHHGHNFFLDAALEQGLLGGLAVLAILGYSAVRMAAVIARNRQDEDLKMVLSAALVSLLVLAFHGLVDDLLYGSRGAFLLWGAPAVGLAALGAAPAEEKAHRRRVAAAVFVCLLVLAAAFLLKPVRAGWMANLGAVRMSRVELDTFPSDRWESRDLRTRLRPASQDFSTALELDPQNLTAHYRQGLIALHFREFDLAVMHLTAAGRLSPDHPGIARSLAYALVWDGRLDEALPMLKRIPGAGQELENYIWWWRSLGRLDLSRNAAAASQALTAP